MPLTVQQDGSVVGGQSNTVVATWWNDYYDLLTGVMTDQDVALHTTLVLKPIGAAPAAPTANAQAGTGLGIGAYQYGVVFIKQGQAGYSPLGTTVTVTTTSGNQAVGLSNIPIGPSGTAARAIYRTVVGGSSFGFVYTIDDNSTTTYIDTTPDSGLGGVPNTSSFGGTLYIKDASNNIKTSLYPDGSANFGAAVSVGGTLSGSAGVSFTGGAAFGSTIFQQGSSVALTGSHSAAQIAVSYGAGVPAALGTNEIYFQIS